MLNAHFFLPGFFFHQSNLSILSLILNLAHETQWILFSFAKKLEINFPIIIFFAISFLLILCTKQRATWSIFRFLVVRRHFSFHGSLNDDKLKRKFIAFDKRFSFCGLRMSAKRMVWSCFTKNIVCLWVGLVSTTYNFHIGHGVFQTNGVIISSSCSRFYLRFFWFFFFLLLDLNSFLPW